MTLATRIRTALLVPILLLAPLALVSCRTAAHTLAGIMAISIITHELSHTHRHYSTRPPGARRHRGWYYNADDGVWRPGKPGYVGAIYFHDGVWYENVEQ